ncbi:MAG: urate hydroxylase PuuD, partial [Pseudomonadota bacterium]
MIDYAILWEWLSFAVRWAHVVAAISWIGTSFYFIALDLGLRRAHAAPAGVSGEEWQVHGGGFYHVQKYMVAPDSLPEHLTWFQWESYATWISGFALLCVVYYAGADLYLIDRDVLDMSAPYAIALSLASLTVGWLVYDGLCRTPIGKSDIGLMVVLYVLLVVMAWAYTQVFTGRAALLHLGAFTATIMTANVFFIIIPNQRKVVASLIAKETPDPLLGQQAKQRSLHNNYLTLPVIFLMLAVHYPLAFATDFNWLIAAIVFLMGVSIRHYFNTYHKSKQVLWWTWGVTLALLALMVWVSTWSLPKPDNADTTADISSTQTLAAKRLLQSAHFEQVEEIVIGKCSMCHAAEPLWENMRVPPGNVRLEDQSSILKNAKGIY